MENVILVFFLLVACVSSSVSAKTKLPLPVWEPTTKTFTLNNISQMGETEVRTEKQYLAGLYINVGYYFNSSNTRLQVKLWNALPPGEYASWTSCGHLRLVKDKDIGPESEKVPFVSHSGFFNKLVETFTLKPRSMILDESNGWYNKKNDSISVSFFFKCFR